MPATTYSILRSAYSRVFLIEGRARFDHTPSYEACLRMTGVTRNFGDITKIECPDPSNYGKFLEVATIRGASERATTSLEGRFALELKSTLLHLASKGCAIDVQVHLGECTDPSDFDNFKKAVVFENVLPTSFSTGELGALSSDQNAAVDETLEISAENMYELLPLSFVAHAGSIVVNEVVDVHICDSMSCGDCESESDGCQKIYAITNAALGSPTGQPDIVFTLNQGVSWYSHDIDSLTASTEPPTALACLGDYMVIVSNAAGSLHYTLLSTLNSYTDPTFTEVATGFVAGGAPNDIDVNSRYAFIVGNGGYVYGTDDPTAGVTVLSAASAVSDPLLRVHALSRDFAVACGGTGAVIYTENGATWTAVTTRPVGAGVNLTALWVKAETEWWVGSSSGRVFVTLDKGVTWTEVTFTGSGAGRVDDIVFATDSEAFIAHTTATPRGRILRSYNAGKTWNVMPETGTLPLEDRVNRLAVCDDPNLIVAVGLADDNADGFILIGSA